MLFMSRELRLFVFLCLATFVGLLAACGGSSNSNTASSGNSGSGSGSSGSGSGTGSASPGSGSGSGSSSSFVSFTYSAGANEIHAYGVNSNGSLTAVSGSPFAFSPAQNDKIATNGSNLYAIDSSFANIDIFSINKSTGALSMAGTSSALTGDPGQGDQAGGLALDHTGSSLYVSVGLSDEDSGINAFTVGSASTVQEIKFLSTGAIAEPPLLFSSNNQFAYSDLCTDRVDGVFGYARASDGTLTSINLANPPGPTGPSGVGFCPGPLAISAKGYMAIVWVPFALASSVPSNQPFVVTYTINSGGTLTEVSNSQVAPASTSGVGGSNSDNPIAVGFDPSGSVLALAGNGGIQTYSLNGSGMLTPVSAPLNAGVSFQNVAWDNSSHVFATSSSQLYVYSSTSGVLTPATGSPYAGDQELTVLPLQ